MKDFLKAAKFLIIDFASTIFFFIVLLTTHSTVLAVALATCLGIVQIMIPIIQRKPVHSLEWLSLFLVITAGTATLLTDNPRMMLFKPSVIYVVVGIAMLKSGWLLRYLPPIAKAVASDVAIAVGYAWAGLMFVTSGVNAFVAIWFNIQTWLAVMLIFGMVSKAVVFVAGFLSIRLITGRRLREMPAEKREVLLATMVAPV
jgi:intracellular septation protein